ncbi:hypothetical protein OUZ56_017301 [Daphnia magna]|uniref:Uncharacterized protein n=1 Tax=Daphnia magna TaxID=35525 RepID=A0ABR0AT34_9CRUS|nr:hypothetical protein OUZ56_017301 [Daphnia magna]
MCQISHDSNFIAEYKAIFKINEINRRIIKPILVEPNHGFYPRSSRSVNADTEQRLTFRIPMLQKLLGV